MKMIIEKLTQGLKMFLGGCVGFIKKIWNHKQGRVGLILVLFLAVVAIFAPIIAPYDPYDVTQRDVKGLGKGQGGIG